MKNVGRRFFSQGILGAPVALGAMQAGVLPTAPPPPNAGSMLGMGLESAKSAKNSVGGSLMDKMWEMSTAQTRDEERVDSLRRERRNMLGGLDPDLAALKSMSNARKVQIQMDREKAHCEFVRSVRCRIIRSLGGNPADYGYNP